MVFYGGGVAQIGRFDHSEPQRGNLKTDMERSYKLLTVAFGRMRQMGQDGPCRTADPNQ